MASVSITITKTSSQSMTQTVIPGSCGCHGVGGKSTRAASIFGHQAQKILKSFPVDEEHRDCPHFVQAKWGHQHPSVLLACSLGRVRAARKALRESFPVVSVTTIQAALLCTTVFLETSQSPLRARSLCYSEFKHLNYHIQQISNKFEGRYLLSISELNSP